MAVSLDISFPGAKVEDCQFVMDRCNVGLVNFALGSGSLARSLVAITETSVSNTVSLQADKVQLASTILMEKTSVGSTAYVGSSLFSRSNLLMNKCNFGWNVEIHPTVFDLSYLRMSSCNCGHRIYTESASLWNSTIEYVSNVQDSSAVSASGTFYPHGIDYKSCEFLNTTVNVVGNRLRVPENGYVGFLLDACAFGNKSWLKMSGNTFDGAPQATVSMSGQSTVVKCRSRTTTSSSGPST